MNAIVFAGMHEVRVDSTIEKIERIVCKNLNVSVQEFRSKKRFRNIIEARSIFFCICRKLNPSLTLQKIGSYLEKDHATVMHGIKNCKQWCEIDKNFCEKFHNCLDTIRGEIFKESRLVNKFK